MNERSETKNTHKEGPTTPRLYLSSAEAGWEALEAEAFHEPLRLEDWTAPGRLDISLIVFTGGSMRIQQRSACTSWQTFSVHQGDLLLRPGTGAPHESRWQTLSSTPACTLHLHLRRELFARTAEEVAGYDAARLSLVERAGFQDPLLTQIGFTLWQELEQRSPTGKLYAQTAAQMLAVHLLRHYTSANIAIKDPASRLTPHQLRRVMDFVQAHLDRDLSLETLAQQAGFSSYHFTRLFRQATGESPHQFVLRQRVERAQSLLSETEMPLVEIALASGFANQSHLTAAFKQRFGLTPLAYRREHSTRATF